MIISGICGKCQKYFKGEQCKKCSTEKGKSPTVILKGEGWSGRHYRKQRIDFMN